MPDIDRQVIRRLALRLLPFFCVLSFVASLDRANVSVAALQMNGDLGFTPEIFGFGAGLFFISYGFFAIPANLALQKLGPRVWLAAILIFWGAVATGMAFIKGATSFEIARFLLGLGEAGFNPAALYLLAAWFPKDYRATAVAQLHWANIFALVLGAPLSGALLSLHGVLGLAGWQVMFILEGLPAVLFGLVVLTYLDDSIEEVRWLTPAQKTWLVSELTQEEETRRRSGAISDFAKIFTSVAIWALVFFWAVVSMVYYGQNLWLPQIIKQISGLPNFEVSVLSGIPYLLAFVAVWGISRFSDRLGHRKLILAVTMLVGACGSVLGGVAQSPALMYLGICLATIGNWGAVGTFWAVARDLLGGRTAALGISFITGMANLIGSFPGSYFIGVIRAHTGSFAGALIGLGVMQVLAAFVPLLLPKEAAKTGTLEIAAAPRTAT